MGSRYDFAEHLRIHGPDAVGRDSVMTFTEASDYCVHLARTHEENFPVLSFAVPADRRRDFAHVYAFCRWADDLGDEVGDPIRSLSLLDWWREEVDRMYAGSPRHPVTIALARTVERFTIPAQPFCDLISAFRQDQTQTRYETFDDLRDYCRRSADPVGRLVLYLLRAYTPERVALADLVCTGLQLANFCQDVSVDLIEKGRVYLPRQERVFHGVTEEDLFARRSTDGFRSLMEMTVTRAEDHLRQGLALSSRLTGRGSLAVELFGHGGLAILRKIRESGYNVLSRRPALTRADRTRVFLRGLAAWAWPSLGRRSIPVSPLPGMTA